MSTVYAKQYGRLGNNLFQKAAAIGYAKKHGINYDKQPWDRGGFSDRYRRRHLLAIFEKGHMYQELPAPEKEVIILDGYWQSEKYFAHCREEVLKAFGFNWLPVFHETCAIHVRRGDYLNYPDKHPVVTEEYLIEAINKIRRNTDIERFMFFSDDIDWCARFVQFGLPQKLYDAYDWAFSEGRTEREDLELMSSCQHQIISNSTFSWWGAWLNQNPGKVVASPSKDNWFGPGNAHLDTSDLIPDSWIQIKY